ncbi:hypothetical protein V5O49_05435, partial [Isoptericola sp. MSP01]
MKSAAPAPPGAADVRPTTADGGPADGGAADGRAAAGGAADGRAVRIMTGAPVPDGFDAVVPVERTST